MNISRPRAEVLFNRSGFIYGSILISFAFLFWALIEIIQKACPPPGGTAWGVSGACLNLPWDLIPIFVASGFDIVGIIVWYFEKSILTTIFFELSGSVLAAGILSGIGIGIGVRAFYIFFVCLSPLIVHFHTNWLELAIGKKIHILLVVLYSLAAILALPFVFLPDTFLLNNGIFPLFRILSRGSILISVGISIGLIINGFISKKLDSYPKIRLVGFGTLAALLPLLLLYLIPYILGVGWVTAIIAIPWLILIPLSYGYSIIRDRPYAADAYIYRLGVWYLLLLLSISASLLLSELAIRIIPDLASYITTVFLVTWALAGAFSVILLQKPSRKILIWVLYGSHIVNLALLNQIIEKLSYAQSKEELLKLCLDDFSAIVPIKCVFLYLLEQGEFRLKGKIGNVEFPASIDPALFETLLSNQNQQIQIDEKDHFKKYILPIKLGLKDFPGDSLNIPLISNGLLIGLWLVGQKMNNEHFSPEEIQNISIIGYQAGIALHTIILIESLRGNQQELIEANQRLTIIQDEAHRRIARELHDGPLQQLITTSYQVKELWKLIQGNQEIRLYMAQMLDRWDDLPKGILLIVDDLRELIGELRPPGLEEFGLSTALEGFVSQVVNNSMAFPKIVLNIDDRVVGLPDAISLCVFRVAQEAVRNSVKHAQADNISIVIKVKEKEVFLKIADDGIGFILPERLSQLSKENHYGLIGLTERVKGAGGKIDINSSPAEGTTITAIIPVGQ